MEARCLSLNALYSELTSEDGLYRGREDDILAAEVDQPGGGEGVPSDKESEGSDAGL